MTDAAARYREALALLVAAGAVAIVVLGDLAQEGDDASLEEGVRLAATVGAPVWVVPGNHDANARPDALAAAVARVGTDIVRVAPPTGVMLGDGVRLTGLADLARDRPDEDAFRTAAPLPVAAWGDDFVLLLMHYPALSLAARAAGAGLKYAGDLADRAAVAASLLRRAAPTVAVHGHLHLRDATAAGALLQLACAAIVEPPFEVTVLDIADRDGHPVVRRESVAVAPSPDVRLPILTPPEESWMFEAGAWRPVAHDAPKLP